MKHITGFEVGINQAIAYIDTVEFFFRYLKAGIDLRSRIEGSQGRRVRITTSKDQNGNLWGYRMSLHQPGIDTLNLLDQIQREHRAVLARVDIAYDFTEYDMKWFESHLILKWRRAGPMWDQENGVYFIQQINRKRRSNRDLMIYNDRPSKLTGELDVTHLDLRFQNPNMIRRQGLHHASDLIKINPKQIFEKHFKLVNFDPEKFKIEIIRETVKDDMLNHNPDKDTAFLDQYRCNIKNHAKSLLERAYQDRIQLIKHACPEFVSKLKPISTDILHLPNILTWGV